MANRLSNYRKVMEFHKCADHPISTEPQKNIFTEKPDRVILRFKLIEEEANEFETAVKEKNLKEVIDALSDILYVVYGMAIEFGIDLDKLYNHGSTNFQKESNGNKFSNLFDRADSVGIGLFQIKKCVNDLNRYVEEKDFDNVTYSLVSLLDTVYKLGIEFGIDLNRSFELVHESNMTKFCKSVEEAELTVEQYKHQYKQQVSRYKNPAYRKSPDNIHWVIYDKDTDKALKSMNYTPVTFDTMLANTNI